MSRTILTTCGGAALYRHLDGHPAGRQTQLVNTNKLLRRYNSITGLKTGTTGGAGRVHYRQRRDGLNLIMVVLGTPPARNGSKPPPPCWTTACGLPCRTSALPQERRCN